MKKQFEIHATDWQLGDVIVGSAGPFDLIVERETPDPVDNHLAGTLLKIVNEGSGESYAFKTNRSGYGPVQWLLLFDDGSYGTFEFTDFKEVEADEKPEAVNPQITRERFIQTLYKTVSDNGLDINSGPLGTLVAFAADRLGLR